MTPMMEQYFEIKNKGKKVKKVTFYDSLKIIPFGVSKIAKSFNLPISKLEIDYNAYRELGHTLTKQEIDYIKNDVTKTQLDILINANVSLVKLYFRIGKIISENFNWGNKIVKNIAIELKLAFQNLKGFSERNLNYMKAFYEEYKDDDNFLHLGAKLLWKYVI